MDQEWVLAELRPFIEMTTLYFKSGSTYRTPRGSNDAIVVSAQTVEKILDRVLPNWRTDVEVDSRGQWQQHRQAAQRSIVELERAAEVEQKLGDTGPRLSAAAFHAWVWEGARSLWSSGHYREAVRAAATKISAELQNKLNRRDIADAKLVQEAFSEDTPVLGKPRLRHPGDDGGQTDLLHG